MYIDTKGNHDHNWDPSKCQSKEMVNQIKRRAQTSTLVVAVGNKKTEISDGYTVQLTMPEKTN